MEERERILHRFRSLNTNKESKNEANGMIAVFIDQGAKETLLREVFGIGYERYRKILHHQQLTRCMVATIAVSKPLSKV